MNTTMRAIEISTLGGPEVLTLCERPIPAPGVGEVLIRVAYAGVNRPDALQRSGSYAPPPGASDLPGLEASGHISAIGPGVAALREGDAVCALLPGGATPNTSPPPPATAYRSRRACPLNKPPACLKPSSPSGPTCSWRGG